MSSVRIVFPKPKLAQLLRSAGGAPVVEALAKAQANLDELKPECLKVLVDLTARIEASFERAPKDGDGEATSELYALAAEGVGIGGVAGLPQADEVLISLCRLVDHLQVRGLWDREALAVHVQTLKFLVNTPNLKPEGADALLKGLERVNQHYKPTDPPA